MRKLVEKISNEVLSCVLYLFSVDREEVKLQPVLQEVKRNRMVNSFPAKARQ